MLYSCYTLYYAYTILDPMRDPGEQRSCRQAFLFLPSYLSLSFFIHTYVMFIPMYHVPCTYLPALYQL